MIRILTWFRRLLTRPATPALTPERQAWLDSLDLDSPVALHTPGREPLTGVVVVCTGTVVICDFVDAGEGEFWHRDGTMVGWPERFIEKPEEPT